MIPHTFSDHNTMKLEINHKKKNWKGYAYLEIKNILLMNEWVNQKLKRKLKSTWKPLK